MLAKKCALSSQFLSGENLSVFNVHVFDQVWELENTLPSESQLPGLILCPRPPFPLLEARGRHVPLTFSFFLGKTGDPDQLNPPSKIW